MKIKILFFIHDMGHGGAEKVLANLVNNMDYEKYDISIIALFKGGVNEQFLNKEIKYKTIFPKMIPANSKIMKLFSPYFLHKLFIKEEYNIEVAYLEGPDARIISGCRNKHTKTVFWVHCFMHDSKEFAGAFRNFKEATRCYGDFDAGAFVSEEVKTAFNVYNNTAQNRVVLYNTNDTEIIVKKSKEKIEKKAEDVFQIIAIGKIEIIKGFDRLARIHKKLIDEGYRIRTIVLGEGTQKEQIQKYVRDNHITESFKFLGYKTNPYKYIAQSNLFVCSSYSEGFSTATTEALILGIPVVTTQVSGMREMLGGNNEYGLITDNSDEALFRGIKKMLDDKNLYLSYKEKAKMRGKFFEKSNMVRSTEKFLESLL